jgi:hypothetical protein
LGQLDSAGNRPGFSSSRILLLLFLANAAFASAAWARGAVEVRLGGAWNVPLPLVVRQANEPEIVLAARWSSRSFRFPLYYAARVLSWEGADAWALDLTHHKIHLANPPPEIQEFAISHGYNLITVQRVRGGEGVSKGVGAGLVLAHPENEVRGRRLDERRGMLESGYYLAGPTLGVLAITPPPVRRGLYASAELRLTLSWARVPIARGNATVPNVALHVTLGVGWQAGR